MPPHHPPACCRRRIVWQFHRFRPTLSAIGMITGPAPPPPSAVRPLATEVPPRGKPIRQGHSAAAHRPPPPRGQPPPPTSPAPTTAVPPAESIRSYERAHYGVGASEGAQYGFILPLAFRLIVRQDYDRVAGFLAAFFADVVRRIEHAARNIGAAIESFLAEHVFEFMLDDVEIVAEWQAQPGLPVEYHHADPVAVSKNLHGLVRRIRQAFDVRLHASAHVEKQQHVDGISSLSKLRIGCF